LQFAATGDFMSQVGTIISTSPIIWAGQQNWSIVYSYQLDAGGTQQAQVFVGTPQAAATVSLGVAPSATIAPWTSPASTIQVIPNPPGTSNPVLLPCPPLAQAGIFGLVLK
jgi:hypothetical protein